MKNFYSQYQEDKIISEYISGKFTGNILDIGANDGKTISNSLHFIESGWGATLIEGSPICFERLQLLHSENKKVQCLNFCLSDKNEKTIFYHNKTHFRNGDIDLLSTVSKESYKGARQAGWEFESFEVDTFRFESIENKMMYDSYDIVSIDIEGLDLQVLRQIDLKKIDCKVLVIEYNNIQATRDNIVNYCTNFGLKNILCDNKTNLVIVE